MPGSASTVAPSSVIDEPDGLFAGFDAGERTPVWMSHGDHVDVPPPGFRRDGQQRQRSDRRDAPRDEAGARACSFIRRSRTRRAAATSSRTSCSMCAARTPIWTPGTFIEEETTRVRERVGDCACHLRAVRRRRFRRRGRARASSDRRSAHVHLRRHGPAAAARARSGRAHVPRAPRHQPRHRPRRGSVPERARGRGRSGEEAHDHRPHVHRRVRGRGRRCRRGRRVTWCRERSIPT